MALASWRLYNLYTLALLCITWMLDHYKVVLVLFFWILMFFDFGLILNLRAFDWLLLVPPAERKMTLSPRLLCDFDSTIRFFAVRHLLKLL